MDDSSSHSTEISQPYEEPLDTEKLLSHLMLEERATKTVDNQWENLDSVHSKNSTLHHYNCNKFNESDSSELGDSFASFGGNSSGDLLGEGSFSDLRKAFQESPKEPKIQPKAQCHMNRPPPLTRNMSTRAINYKASALTLIGEESDEL